MDSTSSLFLQEVWSRLSDIYNREKQRIDQIEDWSPLHVGIFGYVKITRLIPKPGQTPFELAIDVYLPLDWSDSSYKFELECDAEELTDEYLRSEFWPELLNHLLELRQSGTMGPRFFDYRLDVELEFRRSDPALPLKIAETLIDEAARTRVRETLDRFISGKVLSDSPARPKPKDLFFFASWLLNPDLLPEGRRVPDPARIGELLNGVNRKFRAHPERLAQWRGEYKRALRQWAETYFLPAYFTASGEYSPGFMLKPEDQRPIVDQEALDFFLFAALKIGESDPNLRLEYLRYAAMLDSETAARYLKTGSGLVESERIGRLFRGTANDILQQIELKILREEAAAYREALDYLCDLLRQGFTNEYELKLKSAAKHLLPLKKLAKSPLHRFFANALQYPEIFPAIAEYAELAMQEFTWYNDTPPSEKSVMPGTYAVFGLGLYSSAYFPLMLRYMDLVDTEHQSAQDEYAEAFAQAHSPDVHTLPILVAILRAGGQSAKPMKPAPIDSAELAGIVHKQLEPLASHERETVLYRLFGGQAKLVRLAQKAEPDLRGALQNLAALLPESSHRNR